MVIVRRGVRAFCVDTYEAAVVEVRADGTEELHPHYLPVDGKVVRAISKAGVYPQGYISQVQAKEACEASNKRLCRYDEWKTACTSGGAHVYPYGGARAFGVCHDRGTSPVITVFGAKAVAASPVPKSKTTPAKATPKGGRKTPKPKKPTLPAMTRKPGAHAQSPATRPSSVDINVWTQLNDPRLGQAPGAVARTGEHLACTTEDGALDMMGNLHEWVDTDPSGPFGARGVFLGGYFLDTQINGEGCGYATKAHGREYHDYSTGFRCCKDPLDEAEKRPVDVPSSVFDR